MNMPKPATGTFVVCTDSTEDNVDLLVGKLYRVFKPEKNDPPSMLRVIDDSGEDYLYSIEWFAPVDLPLKVRRKLLTATAAV
jgi:hypothetical protein